MKILGFNVSRRQKAEPRFVNMGSAKAFDANSDATRTIALVGDRYNPEQFTNPRTNIQMVRLLVWAFPFLDRAISMHSEMMGEIELYVEGDDLATEMLRLWADNIEISNPLMPSVRQKGLTALLQQKIKIGLRDGCSFYEEVLDGELPGVNAVRLLRSEDFEPKKNQSTGTYDLQYTNPANQVKTIIQPSDYFHHYSHEPEAGALWGTSLLNGAQFMGHVLIVLVELFKVFKTRFANPMSLDLLSLEDGDLTPTQGDSFEAKAKEIKEEIVKGQKSTMAGKAVNLFNAFTGKLKFEHTTYGHTNNDGGYFPADYKLIASQLAIATKVPPEFLGFEMGGGGLGSDRFRILNGILGATVEGYRRECEVDALSLVLHHAEEGGIPINWVPNIKLRWKEMDTSDAKLIADTRLAQAQAAQAAIDAFGAAMASGMVDVTNPDSVRTWAEANAINWIGEPK
jgi:hypothetical protein